MSSQTTGQTSRDDEREFYRSIAEEARDIILVIKQDGYICYANPAAIAAYGYEREALYSLRVHELRDPATMPEIELQLQMARVSGVLFRTIHRRRNGELFPVEVSSRAVRSAEGEVYVSVIRDILELQRVEEARRRQQELVHGIVEGLDIPFFAVDRAYRYLVFNQSHVQNMKRLFGVDVQLGESILEYHKDPAVRQTVRQNLDLALSGEACAVESLVGDAQWEQQVLRVEHNPIRDSQGQIIGVVIFSSDISKQKKAEQEARACDLRYRELVEDTQVIIMALSAAGNIGYLNEYGQQFFGYASPTIRNKPVCELLIPELEVGGRNLRQLYAALWTNQAEGLREIHENRTAAGKRVWVNWLVRRGVNPQSGEAGWLCVGIDVTAKQRLLEEERKGYERRRCNELMQDIIAGRLTARQVQQNATQLRLNLSGPFICMVFAKEAAATPANDDAARRHVVDDWLDSLKQQTAGIAWEANEGLCLLLPYDAREEPLTVAAVKARVAGVMKNFDKYGLGKLGPVGVAYQSPPSVDLPLLYEQAATALNFGCLHQANEAVCIWQELGWLRLLAKDIQSPAAQQYVADCLGPLLGISPPEKSRALLATLRELLAGGMFDVIGERLNVHPQTVRYRKRVIEKLLHIQLDAQDNRTNLSIALKLYEVQQAKGIGNDIST